MRIKLTHIAALFICIVQIAWAELPKPIRYYPLNNLDFSDVVNHKNGQIKRAAAWSYPDRFDHISGAVELAPYAYIETPNFFEGSIFHDGFTISFWTFINEEYTKYSGVYPWENTDKIYRCFFCYNEPDNCNLFGFYHRRDRAVVDRYTVNINDSRMRNWGIWYWDPVNFTKRIGWYQVFLVCKNNMTWLYIFYPNSQMEYALYYMGYQTFTPATKWGLGSYTPNSVRYLDDFKVYNEVLTKEQVIELHSQESLPNGMYEVSYAYDLSKVLQSYGKSLSAGPNLVMTDKTPSKELAYQWVFEPVGDKPSVVRVRMAYNKIFMGARSSYENVVLLQEDHSQGSLLEWYIEPAGDGYFFIRSNANRNNYLYVDRGNIRMSSYNSAQAPLYKWRFKQLKSQYELSQSIFDAKKAYQVIDNYNTIMGLILGRPVVRPMSTLYVNREAYPSLLSHYKFDKTLDNSYFIWNASYTNMGLYPKDASFTDWSEVSLREWNSQEPLKFQYIVERTNPLGRHVTIKPVLEQSKYVYSGNYPTGNIVTFASDAALKQPEAKEWQFFNNGGNPNANRQISTITPGIYKIRSFEDQSLWMKTLNNAFTTGTKVELDFYRDSGFSSFYWIVDYEKDNNGQDVRDGSFTIQAYGTEFLFLAPKDGNISEGATVYIEKMNRDRVPFYKWFIEPTRDRTGTFYLENGADKLKHLQSPLAPIKAGGKISFSYRRPGEKQETYRWKFEKAEIPAPLESGRYYITNSTYGFLQVHTLGDYKTKGIPIAVNENTHGGTYIWEIVKNPDFSYNLRVGGTQLFVHPKNNNLSAGTQLVADEYNSDFPYAFKWIITPTGNKDEYYLNLVGNPFGGYFHLTDNQAYTGNTLSIGNFIQSEAFGYKFTIRKAPDD